MKVKAKNYTATGFKGEKVNAGVTLTFAVTPRMRREIRIAAMLADLSASEWLRRMAKEKLEESKA